MEKDKHIKDGLRGMFTKYGFLGIFLCGIVLSTGCTKEETDGIVEDSPIEVLFTVKADGVATPEGKSSNPVVPQTRTTSGGTEWSPGDGIGIFMVTANGSLPGDIINGYANKHYTITDAAAGSLFPVDGTNMFYPPGSGNVGFIAYYPYQTSISQTDLTSLINVADQTTPQKQAEQDFLYSNNVINRARSSEAVKLEFNHVLGKMVLNVKKGDGMGSVDFSPLTLKFNNFPCKATFSAATGSLFDHKFENTILPLKLSEPSSPEYVATFEVLMIPYSLPVIRDLVFTVDQQEFKWYLPSDVIIEPGKLYTYEATIHKTTIEVQ